MEPSQAAPRKMRSRRDTYIRLILIQYQRSVVQEIAAAKDSGKKEEIQTDGSRRCRC